MWSSMQLVWTGKSKKTFVSNIFATRLGHICWTCHWSQLHSLRNNRCQRYSIGTASPHIFKEVKEVNLQCLAFIHSSYLIVDFPELLCDLKEPNVGRNMSALSLRVNSLSCRPGLQSAMLFLCLSSMFLSQFVKFCSQDQECTEFYFQRRSFLKLSRIIFKTP